MVQITKAMTMAMAVPQKVNQTLATIPVPRSAAGVRTTLAPNALIVRRRSMLNDSAIVTTKGYPLAAQTIAKATPVFPLVPSTTVCPGLRAPAHRRGRQHKRRLSFANRFLRPVHGSFTHTQLHGLPDFSASSMMARARRSLTLLRGLKYLVNTRHEEQFPSAQRCR